MPPHIQCQPWWEEVPSPGAGIVVPHYLRNDGYKARFSTAHGCWVGVWPNGDIINDTLAATPVGAMNAIDDLVPREALTSHLQRPVSVAISPHNETLVLTDAGRFYWLRIASESGVPRPYWDELKLPPLPTVFE